VTSKPHHHPGKPTGPKLQPVDSAMIKAIGWEASKPSADHGTLHVQFSDGKVWEYIGVEKDKWKNFHRSSSKGAFFHSNIKPHHTGKRRGS
jgi:hypothetical protein